MFGSLKLKRKRSFRRIVAVVGPTGCGKSSFLDDPYGYVSAEQFPDQLSEAAIHAPRYWELRHLTQMQGPSPDTVWVHIDIFNVLNGHRSRPASDLLQMISPELVAKWSPLSLLRDAEELHLVTMVVSHPVASRRFMDREVSKVCDRSGRLRNNLYDLGEKSEQIYQQIYESWYSFGQSLGATSNWTLLGDAMPYKLVNGQDYLRMRIDGLLLK